MATCADLARRLLDAAENDELMAKSVLQVPGVTDAGVGMLTQQAVEKAIKAVLSAKQTKFPFTHDLKQLKEFAKESGIDLPTTLNGVERLTPFARDERYGSEAPISLDRDQALRWAAAAIAWAQGIVGRPEPRQSSTLGQAAEDAPKQE